jgi:hypothetical protein
VPQRSIGDADDRRVAADPVLAHEADAQSGAHRLPHRRAHGPEALEGLVVAVAADEVVREQILPPAR